MVEPDASLGVDLRTAAVVAVAVLLLAAQAGLVAFVVGLGPFDAGAPGWGGGTTPGPSDSIGERSSGSGSIGVSGGSGPSGADGGTARSSGSPPYDLDVLGTERCGNTCRDVTVRLTNNRNGTARDVAVRTRIYAGNTTNEDARVWEGRSEVGSLEAGASTTETARVSLSYFEALSVQRKGGWVTIVTTVESERTTRSFEERREVA